MLNKRFVIAMLAGVLTVGSCPWGSAVALASPDVTMLAADTTTSTASSGEVASYAYTVSEEGSFKGDKDDIRFDDNAALVKKDDAYQLLAGDGEPVMNGKLFSKVIYWGNGVYEVRAKDGDVHGVGLVRIDGTVLMPCEAAVINTQETNRQDARFVRVAYATGQTTSKDSALLSTGKDNVYWGTGGDVLYEGYARVFDLKAGSFVDGVKIEDPKASFADMGSSFAVGQDGGTVLYDELGKELWKQSGDIARLYPRFILWSKDGKYQIVDATGKGRYTSEDSVQEIEMSAAWSGGDYVVQRVKEAGSDSSRSQIIDFDGKPICSKTFYHVAKYTNGLFLVKENEDDEQYKLIDTTGAVVLDNVGASLERVMMGYNCINEKDGNYVLLKGDKKLAEDKSGSDLKMLVSVKDDMCLVVNEGTYSMPLDKLQIEPLDLGLATGRQGDSMRYGLYDTFTGKQIIKDDYDLIRRAGGKIFAYHDGTWTVFGAKLSQQ